MKEKEENLIKKCNNCGADYIHKQNILGFCNLCVRNELVSNLMATYLVYSTEAVQLYVKGKESKIPELLNSGNFVIFIFYKIYMNYLKLFEKFLLIIFFSFNTEISNNKILQINHFKFGLYS